MATLSDDDDAYSSSEVEDFGSARLGLGHARPRPPGGTPGPASTAPNSDGEDEEEGAWDEVDVEREGASALAAQQVAAAEAAARAQEINIVLREKGKGKGKGKPKDKANVALERMVRQERHKTHILCHLALGKIRNRWITDSEVKARLLSKVPAHLINAFSAFNRHTHPNERDRSRLWEAALKDLTAWWSSRFHVLPTGHLVRRLATAVQAELDAIAQAERANRPKAAGRLRREMEAEMSSEAVRSTRSLSKHVRAMQGSRDMAAQLFTSLCRALGLGARLVFSLQPVDWRAPGAAGGLKGKAKIKAQGGCGENGERAGPRSGSQGKGKEKEEREWRDGRGELSYKPPPIRLRRNKVIPTQRSLALDPSEQPPVMWTEVYSPYLRQWIVIDPVRNKLRCKDVIEPSRSSLENQLLYVVAFEEDGSARDVTARYAKAFNNHTAKMRVPNRKGTNWWEDTITRHKRSFELNRDREETAELEGRKANEPLPTSLGAFKNHPNYVLEQHLHRDQVIRPGTKQIGLFNGQHQVFPRSGLVELKSAENYYRVGRVVRPGEMPLKWVKQQVSTINRRRAEEFNRLEGLEAEKQALYEHAQTELYVPPPVVDGKVPRNDFGNIDLFVPTMLPAGAVHLPSKQAAKCAKALEIAYAEAIVGFEFRSRRATPTIAGIVVATEHADAVLQAIFAAEEANDAKEFRRLQDRCLKRWKKLILGLRIRQRLDAQYGSDTFGTGSVSEQDGASQFARRAADKRARDDSAGGFDDDRLSLGTASDADLPPPRKASRTSRAPRLAPIPSQAELDQPAYSVPAALYTHDFAPKEEEPEPEPERPVVAGRTLRPRASKAPEPALGPATARVTRGRARAAGAAAEAVGNGGTGGGGLRVTLRWGGQGKSAAVEGQGGTEAVEVDAGSDGSLEYDSDF